MNKGEIYQNGFYLMVGAILGIIGTCTFNSVTTQQEVLIKTEVKRDTIVAMRPDLNEQNLKEKLARLPHHDVVFKQAKLESRLGKSKVYKRTNNLFGLRKNGVYRSYDHWTECVDDYERLISSRYKGGCYYTFLKRIGYAEDPNYISKLKMI